MPHVPGLRSPYLKVGRLVYFGRMIDKIHLRAAGQLPPDYIASLGNGLDDRCLSFLRISHDALTAFVLADPAHPASPEAALAWAEQHGGAHTDEECEVWNGFMMKRGWRDLGAEALARRIKESALEAAPILTMFDYVDFDEGRDPVATRA